MKTYLAMISAAVLGLAACSQEAPKSAETTAPAAESPASVAMAASAETASVAAADAACSTVVESDDAMKFNVSEINISKACPQFSITLKHVGKMPKAAMGHNIVISKAEDVDAVVKESAAAGADNEFVKTDDARVIAHSSLIGGGEETTFTVDTGKFAAGNQYEFFCSFPGHAAMMRGKVNLTE
ncbi:azurin [Neisseria sp. S1]|uniref:azurin n=1 Tax=Neisseria sp. S1 TaxID=3318354 RepID=UPI003A8B1FD6